MKTVIVALNAKYVHSSLAAWYLKSSCGEECGEIEVMEFTINDSLDSILAAIYLERPDVAAFSCYIWNMENVLKLAENLKKVCVGVKLVLGGPEVSFDAVDLMDSNPYVDYIISGEGELSFKLLLRHLQDGTGRIEDAYGLAFRTDKGIKANKPVNLIENLDSIPTPYTDDMFNSSGGRIMYFESSRGCPFSCSYCISSTFHGVRYFTLDRVKSDLLRIMKSDARQIKFVDRTFNCNRERAKEIFRFVIENAPQINPGLNFHFETAADLFDEEITDILAKAPAGLIQLEIGIQTTNAKALKAIDRVTRLDRVYYYVNKLRENGNIHLHLDLIAGLPEEDFQSFRNSFDDVYNMRPHQLQLGFLKMLKGSKLRAQSSSYGYVFREYPPYEVLFNNYMTFGELLELKKIEEMVERYYNSGRFVKTLEYIIPAFFGSPFEFYRKLSAFGFEKGYLDRALSSRELYSILFEFIKTVIDQTGYGLLNDYLKLDFLASDSSNNLPGGLERTESKNFKEWCFEFLKNEQNIRTYLPGYINVPAKQIFKNVHFEKFDHLKTLLLFDYGSKNRVTGLYNYFKL